MKINKKAFTLIEMLIVIVIIGILAAALVPRLQAVQGRARDTKRKTDLMTIYKALEIYKIDTNNYPTHLTWVFSTSAGIRIPALSGVVNSMPIDPKNNLAGPWGTGNYSYAYGAMSATGSTDYNLVAQLENTSDPERCYMKAYRYGGGYRCNNAIYGSTSSYGYTPYLYEYSFMDKP